MGQYKFDIILSDGNSVDPVFPLLVNITDNDGRISLNETLGSETSNNLLGKFSRYKSIFRFKEVAKNGRVKL